MIEGWKCQTLAEIASVYNGNSIPPKEKKEKYIGLDSGTPYIGTKDVSFDHVIDYENGILIPEFKSSEFKIAPKKSVLVCAEGGSAGRKVAHNDKRIHFGNKLFAIVPNANADSKYLFYYCISKVFFGAFSELKTGVIGGVSLKKFRNLMIPIPPLSEQERIVEILDEAFAAIATTTANTEKNLANARELFESELNRVFSQKGDGWVERTLGEMSHDFGRGKSKHRPRNAGFLYGGDYPFVQTGDIRNSEHIISNYTQTYSEAGLSQSKLWPAGTICITIAANIAETGILRFDACFPDSIIGMVPEPEKSDSGYVEYLLRLFKTELQRQGKGSAQDNINLGTFKRQKFPFAPLPEQQAIAAKLDALSEEIKSLEGVQQHKLTALIELKQSILHKAFTGELNTDAKAADRTLSEAGP